MWTAAGPARVYRPPPVQRSPGVGAGPSRAPLVAPGSCSAVVPAPGPVALVPVLLLRRVRGRGLRRRRDQLGQAGLAGLDVEHGLVGAVAAEVRLVGDH